MYLHSLHIFIWIPSGAYASFTIISLKLHRSMLLVIFLSASNSKLKENDIPLIVEAKLYTICKYIQRYITGKRTNIQVANITFLVMNLFQKIRANNSSNCESTRCEWHLYMTFNASSSYAYMHKVNLVDFHQ